MSERISGLAQALGGCFVKERVGFFQDGGDAIGEGAVCERFREIE